MVVFGALTLAFGRTPLQVPADLWTAFVDRAEELGGAAGDDPKGGTMSIGHLHIRPLLDEVGDLLRAGSELCPVLARHAHKFLGARETTGTTVEAGDRGNHETVVLRNLPLAELHATVSTRAMDAYLRARQLIDAAHTADPVRVDDGRAAELVYADHMEGWVTRLVPNASPLLLLAARAQHLERWSVPRNSFPLERAGYLAWRRSLYTKQAERARELLIAAGVSAGEADEAATWVSKTGLKTNPGTQALEDAACLVFLESEIAAFAAQHAEYPREKFLHILRKTWRKMNPDAQQAALNLPLPAPIAELVREAVAAA